jgi:FKBP-type peptidyl-prolyl cis-trans isomerase SlyD
MQTVTKDSVVAIHYTVRNAQGVVQGTSRDGLPMVFLQGRGQVVPGLERALLGCRAGARLDLRLDPAEAFGQRDEEWCQTLPRSFFAGVGDIQPGMQFRVDTPEGQRTLAVIKVNGDSVDVDGNHPLAGQSVWFDVEVRHVRPASAQELQEGIADP